MNPGMRLLALAALAPGCSREPVEDLPGPVAPAGWGKWR